ncbi:MAG: hypothetical protein ACUVT6_13440 [Thermodesulfobacteriota bacterium]
MSRRWSVWFIWFIWFVWINIYSFGMELTSSPKVRRWKVVDNDWKLLLRNGI